MAARNDRGRRLGIALAAALVAAAVTKELRKPSSERTWEGRLAGFLPYDLRVPTPARLRAAFWNPDDPTIFTPRPLGVGWVVNVGRVVRLARERVS
ncbi:MAG TPA: DUF5808 domain-containing protein [Gaiellaceae bacterium]|nr:DUF5808 domain-containing protein [Gaiellaceae bacterium]